MEKLYDADMKYKKSRDIIIISDKVYLSRDREGFFKC